MYGAYGRAKPGTRNSNGLITGICQGDLNRLTTLDGGSDRITSARITTAGANCKINRCNSVSGIGSIYRNSEAFAGGLVQGRSGNAGAIGERFAWEY